MTGRIFKAVLACALVFSSAALNAQDDKTRKDAQTAAAEAAKALSETPEAKAAPPKPVYWTKNLKTDLKFSQQNFTNWATGGINNVTLASYIVANANYAKGKRFWNNNIQLDYGFIYQDSDKSAPPFIQKSTDRMYLESKYGKKISDKLNLSAKFDLLSQFTDTYTYAVPRNYSGDSPSKQDWLDSRSLKSGLFSPAYVHVGIGIDWIPNTANRWLTVNFQPLTGGFTIVRDRSLRRGYGMHRKKAFKDETLYPYADPSTDGRYFRPARFELGAQLTADLAAKINDNLSYTSQLILFSNYLDKPQNVRVNWVNRINWALSKHFSLSLTTFTVYDDKVMIRQDSDIEKYPNGRQRVQFQELFGLGFTYSFPLPKK